MNAKVCKRMRRMAVAATEITSDYEGVYRRGKTYYATPRRLIPNCQRAIYKDLKRRYRAANQTIRARLNANA